jgi:hypothetical protein
LTSETRSNKNKQHDPTQYPRNVQIISLNQ